MAKRKPNPEDPYLKWAGGKRKLAKRIKKHLPKEKRLVEPFVGSGSIFMATDYEEYLLADKNERLIVTHEMAGLVNHYLISHLAEYWFTPEMNTPKAFKAEREEFNCRGPLENDFDQACRFIYLNRHCYSGLYRENLSGRYNVPFGRYDIPYFPKYELLAWGRKVNSCNVEFKCADFVETIASAGEGSVIYADPPYVELTKTASFSAYSGAFGPQHQADLVAAVLEAKGRGVASVISNHDTPESRELYAAADEIVSFTVTRSIGANSSDRVRAPELLAIYRP